MNKYKGKKVAVLGLGMEGVDAVNFLLKRGASVTVFDQKNKSELDTTGIDENKVSFVTGESYLQQGFDQYHFLVRSPGIYRYKDELIKAEMKGIEITSAIKIFFDECPAKIIGVTGTKGKGTTSTLIYEILKRDCKDTYLVGNIGKPYLEILDVMNSNSWVVMELSSFQLIDLEKSPHIAVVLNITLDHMDWHKNREEYVTAKMNILKHQGTEDYAVLQFDFETPRSFSSQTHSHVYYVSPTQKVKGCYVENGDIILHTDKDHYDIGDTSRLLLRGKHNWENVTAAVCAASLAGASINSIKESVFSFKGLEHRLELVRTVNGVTYYNDSFSTNPGPTVAAINAFDEPLTLILGGSDKQLDYEGMSVVIAKKENIKNVILIGDIAPQIKHELESADYNGEIIEMDHRPMKEVVTKAHKVSEPGFVVILSPATASFDMFPNYKERGKQFKDAVKDL